MYFKQENWHSSIKFEAQNGIQKLSNEGYKLIG